MGYLEILSKAAGAMKWAWSHPRLAGEILLAAMLVITGWFYNRKVAELANAKLETGQLEDGLKQQITMVNGQLEILRKENGKLLSQHVYIPPEGSVVIKQQDLDDLKGKYRKLLELLAAATTSAEREKLQAEINRLLALLNGSDTTVIIRDNGFTFKPGFGMEWAGQGLSPRIDAKLFYYKRYSALLGVGKGGMDISASRHLDDILWGRPQNIELFSGWKFLRMPGASQLVIGLRANF